uniref:Serine/threonine-protein phosphatase 4 regulatory subunit 3-like central domain-containing protein n=1 Tax=Arcella intermedia TaxID=1963864 RepID=A0A6B2L125_9EUKA|eukprot:TRINITY_DN4486_c0_g1_i1.p1 TRINITY_DN4486_c0_g1~~TRINITY_DN4486_c0_g1_i1.p1  ORF type:complete len:562 (-),score=120.62 TRINITY_DN4486_c0_g1_i1:69-1754(-)
MAFWNNFSFPSPVDDILKRPGFTLQDLLDEDEVVVETRNQKQDLLAFLTTKENINQLITYIVSEPDAEAPVNVKMRYPVVACEILSSDIAEIERVLIENEEFLDRIFRFYENPKINLLLSNLVVKVAKSLITSKVEPMVGILKKNAVFIDYLLNHLESSAVTEFFTKLVNLDGDFEGKTTQQWLVEIGFVEKLIEKLDKKFIDIHSDVCQAILDIIGAATWGGPVMIRFVSLDVSRLIFKIIMDPANPTSFKYGLKIFNKLLRGLSVAQEDNQDSDEDEEKPKLTKPDPLGPLEQLPPPIQVFAEHLEKFCNLLRTPLSTNNISDQSRCSYQAFGFDRLVILELIDALLDLNYMAVNKLILKSDVFPVGLKLMFEFPHNNFCHRALETIFVKFLENSGQEAQLTFLEKTDLPKKLVATDKLFGAGTVPTQDGKPLLYRPYLHRIVYSIGEIAERATHLKDILEGVEGWNDLLNFIKEEKKKSETSSAAAKVEEEPTYFQPPASLDVPDIDGNDGYEEGRDNDDEDLNLDDDQDMDSANDADDYDADQAEILLTKQEIEASA